VDLLQFHGSWVIGEIEITEPGLYVDVDPGIAEAYADAIVAALAAGDVPASGRYGSSNRRSS
jgi:hypothetical protein